MKKKVMLILVSAGLLALVCNPSYGSDWDTVGEVFAGIEGMRLLTGGKIDILGSIAGLNNDSRYVSHQRHHHIRNHHDDYCKRFWVPNIVWKKKWIPRHSEYNEEFDEIIVEGHYIKCKVENGGYWRTVCPYRKHTTINRRRKH